MNEPNLPTRRYNPISERYILKQLKRKARPASEAYTIKAAGPQERK